MVKYCNLARYMAECTKHIRIKAAMVDADIDLVLERKEDGKMGGGNGLAISCFSC